MSRWSDLASHPQVVYSDDLTILFNGDSRLLIPELAEFGVKFDLLLTDPPYGVEKGNSGRDIEFEDGYDASRVLIREVLNAALKLRRGEPSSAIVWMGFILFGVVAEFLEHNFSSTRLLTWVKTNPMPMYPSFGSAVEMCLFGSGKGRVWNYSRDFQWNVLAFPSVSGPDRAGHPTAKPTLLMKKLILAATNPGQVVIDPFSGSGSTLRAAKAAGRRSIGIELDPKFCDSTAAFLRDPEKDGSLSRVSKPKRCFVCENQTGLRDVVLSEREACARSVEEGWLLGDEGLPITTQLANAVRAR